MQNLFQWYCIPSVLHVKDLQLLEKDFKEKLSDSRRQNILVLVEFI